MGTPPAAGPDDGLTIQLLGGFRVRVGDRARPRRGLVAAQGRPRWSSCWRWRPATACRASRPRRGSGRSSARRRRPTTCTGRSTPRAASSTRRTGGPSCLHLAGDGLRLRAAGPALGRRGRLRGGRGGGPADRRPGRGLGGGRALRAATCCRTTPTRSGRCGGARRCGRATWRCCWGWPSATRSAGELDRAIEALQRALASEPAHEAAHRGLMRCYALAGQTDQAHPAVPAVARGAGARAGRGAGRGQPAALPRDRRRAADPPGARPDASRRAAATATEPATRAGADRAPAAAPVRPPCAAPPPTNLPLPLTSFVGRERELAEVAAAAGRRRGC